MDSRDLDNYITGHYGEDRFRKNENQADCTIKGVMFKFIRRRYGRQTFTWLHWLDEDSNWQEYKGDPWPSVRIPRKDLERIAGDLMAEIDKKYLADIPYVKRATGRTIPDLTGREHVCEYQSSVKPEDK